MNAQPISNQQHWGQLYGAGFAHQMAQFATKQSALTWVILPTSRERERFEQALAFFAPDVAQLSLPSWEVLLYDRISPASELTSQRLHTMAQLQTAKQGVLTTTLETALQNICPPEHIAASQQQYRVGDTLNPTQLAQTLTQQGYFSVSQVREPGEFALRGSLVDVFIMGHRQPLRIDLLDNDIESLRRFNPDDQRSLQAIDAFQLLPAKEYPLTETAINEFRKRYRQAFPSEQGYDEHTVYTQTSAGTPPSGIEQFLPLFFEQLHAIGDLLPKNSTVVLPNDWPTGVESLWQHFERRHESRQHDVQYPILPPAALFQNAESFAKVLSKHQVITWQSHELIHNDAEHINFHTKPAPNCRPLKASEPPRLSEFRDSFNGRILLAAESAGKREHLLEYLREANMPAPVHNHWQSFVASDDALGVCVAPMDQGFVHSEQQLALLTSTELYTHTTPTQQRQARNKDAATFFQQIEEIKIDEPVVHEHYGVGRYRGLTRLDIGGVDSEFLLLEYADQDKIYVPVHALYLVSRYLGADADHAPMHQLGTGQWEKAKKRAAKQVRDVAAELLELYAKREAAKGVAIKLNSQDTQAFADSFAFTLTPDQADAVLAITEDLASNKPMDRLVCGDVGFGKTEVALRAAFIVAMSGKQVAVLVPTTLLAQQHAQSFRDRFADWPLKIGELSRFKTPAENKAVLDDMASGKLDIVVGTHKLLQPGIVFKQLGLIVVDEEHRFGVRHKEALKTLRADTDVLTLTATPIPRTLNLSLGGLRDISLITTPPPNRIAIQTFISEWDPHLIRDACLREFKRGGQVYFVHNRVQDIENIQHKLSELIPEASIEIAHGQMPERALEHVMLKFFERRFNLLLCTTIVESGLDLPNANTILINRAERMGLAQLHQLRGRVGRSHHRAFAYLITPPKNTLKEDAQKRLEAIESADELGAGFSLAQHDLEIRGAGELLGAKQSGRVHEVGFTLYLDMLKRTVKRLKQDKTNDAVFTPLAEKTEINLHAPAFFPDHYLPDVELRLRLYKRLANCPLDELAEFKMELIDRFGNLPEQTEALLYIQHLRAQASLLGAHKVDAHATGGRVVFAEQTSVQPETLITFILKDNQRYRLDGANTLRFNCPLPEIKDRFDFLNKLLAELMPTS